jgi:hypothetical protein
MSTQAEKFKEIANAIRGVNDRTSEYTIVANNFASEIKKLDPRIIPYNGRFENGYYGVRAARIAATYYNARSTGVDTFKYSVNSLFSSASGIVRDGSKASIDCSTYVGLCLRGIPYEKSPYALYKGTDARWTPATELESMYGTEGWEFRVLDAQPEGVNNNIGITGASTIRFAASLGEYFYKHGYVLYDSAIDGTLTDIGSLDLRPGDLIFESDTSNTAVLGRFKSISHVLIVAENPSAFHHVTSATGVVLYGGLSSRTFDDIVLICRPDYRPRMPKEETPIGLNLLGYPWLNLKDTDTTNGLTFTVDDMNTFTVNGTSTASLTYGLKGLTNSENHITLSPGVYELSGITGRTGTSVALQLRKSDGTDFDTPVRYPTSDSTTNVVTIEEETDVIVRFYCSSGKTFNNEKITPNLVRIS